MCHVTIMRISGIGSTLIFRNSFHQGRLVENDSKAYPTMSMLNLAMATDRTRMGGALLLWLMHGIVWKGSPKSTDSWSCSLLFHIQIAVLFFFPSSTLRNCWNLSDSVLGDGDKIGGVEFLHVSTLSSIQIKRNRKAKPWPRLHRRTWSQQLFG